MLTFYQTCSYFKLLLSSLVVLLRKQQAMSSKYFIFEQCGYAIVCLKVLDCYFDPNRFLFWIVGRLRSSRFGTGGTICSLARLRIQKLKSVTECQSLGVVGLSDVQHLIVGTISTGKCLAVSAHISSKPVHAYACFARSYFIENSYIPISPKQDYLR